MATQFHPEKSGAAGLELLDRWLRCSPPSPSSASLCLKAALVVPAPARRLIACLDVRSNDAGDLVVTKGDQYDVRESSATESKGQVRNLGKPVALAERYYEDGADEVTFLNITAFREVVLSDQPLLEVLRGAAAKCFVPMTVGGGIRGYTDATGKSYTAVEVADAYFRAGADKVSIGTDSVDAARAFFKSGRKRTGQSSIEQISEKYGRQAVVISIDPRRVYVKSPDGIQHPCVEAGLPGGIPLGPAGESWVWYVCTLKGGRENSELDVVQMAEAVEALGAGEILLNCIDRDGTNSGFELDLIRQVKAACSIPVIASSGAGKPEHFVEALRSKTSVGEGAYKGGGGGADAVLGAGIFHRQEIAISEVKRHIVEVGKLPVRL